MPISDKIENFIIQLLKEEDDWVEIGRNELASIFHCVPSQINYVISTRFSPQRGYIVESKRGGGGFLKIKRMPAENEVSHILSLVGDSLVFSDMKAFVDYLSLQHKLTDKEASIILAGLSNKSLSKAGDAKDKVRAESFKNILISM